MSRNLMLKTTSGASADGKSYNTATAELTDTTGPVKNSPLLFTLSGNATFDNGTNILSALTNNEGKASVKFMDTLAETITVSVIDAPFAQRKAEESTFAGSNDMYKLSVQATSGAAPDGKSKNKITVQLTDAQNQPAGHKIIDLNTDKHAIFTDTLRATTSVITDANGSKEVYITDEEEELVNITATWLDDNNVVAAHAETESGFGKAAHPYLLTLDAESGSPADGKSTNKVTAVLKNRANGTPVSHRIIDLMVIGHALFKDSGKNTTSLITRQDGSIVTELTNTLQEGNLVIATSDYSGGVEKAFNVTHFDKVHHYSLAITSGNGAYADNKAQNKISLSLKDEEGENIAHAKIHLTVNGSALFSNNKQDIYIETNEKGIASDYITDTEIETVSLVASYINDTSATANTTSSFQKKELGAVLSCPESIDRKPGFYLNVRGTINQQFTNSENIIKHITIHSDDKLYINGAHDYSGVGNIDHNNLRLPILGDKKGKGTVDMHVELVDGQQISKSFTVNVS